jgi:hypothetical protein
MGIYGRLFFVSVRTNKRHHSSSERGTCLNARADWLLTTFNKQICDVFHGSVGAVCRLISIFQADLVDEAGEIKGDYCTFIPCVVIALSKYACNGVDPIKSHRAA